MATRPFAVPSRKVGKEKSNAGIFSAIKGLVVASDGNRGTISIGFSLISHKVKSCDTNEEELSEQCCLDSSASVRLSTG